MSGGGSAAAQPMMTPMSAAPLQPTPGVRTGAALLLLCHISIRILRPFVWPLSFMSLSPFVLQGGDLMDFMGGSSNSSMGGQTAHSSKPQPAKVRRCSSLLPFLALLLFISTNGGRFSALDNVLCLMLSTLQGPVKVGGLNIDLDNLSLNASKVGRRVPAGRRVLSLEAWHISLCLSPFSHPCLSPAVFPSSTGQKQGAV
jgi:hypothetical protein